MSRHTIERGQCAAHRHGTDIAYSQGCRCDDARAMHAASARNRRLGLPVHHWLIDPRPTARRLQVLAGLGYDWRTLARTLGWTSRSVTELAKLERKKVRRATAARIANLLRDLIAQPAPVGYAAARALDNAMRAGWGVVDRVAVDMALAGCDVHLTKLEQHAVLYIGAARGLPHNVLADAARMSYATARERLDGASPRKEHQAA